MIRASLTSIEALSPLVRVIRAEEFDLLVAELEELRRRDRERVDLAYEERAAVVAWLGDADMECGERTVLARVARLIERGEHRREEGA